MDMDRLVDYLGYSPRSTSPHFELFNAAYTGKLNRFKRLALNIAEGEGVGVTEAIGKVKDEDGGGSLHFAAAGGSLNVCRYLIEKLKFDLDSKDDRGSTPLYRATTKRRFDTVRYLLEKGANTDGTTDMTHNPLHFAASSGDADMITLLLSRGVRVDVATRCGPALVLAAHHGLLDAVKVLLDHGANPNCEMYLHMKPLISAILVKSQGCMNLLLQQGMTALEIAAIKCNYQIVGVLFPVTSRIPTYPDWSIAGLIRHVNSDANKMQRVVHVKEKFHQAKSRGRDAFQGEQYLTAALWYEEALSILPKDAAVLSNMSACYAHLDDGVKALDYATKCIYESPEWPKAYYRLGVALNIHKRYDDAADAFFKGLTLDPRNKELKEAYM
ncbi:serine/threonine-protein phosphatase 6 regulatory ankyrin repeat subunit B-like isoform X2 [Papaver somniferum]|nr:serine/threonine-protein phosphatase 6 regulatory ankyrin repeat subunit B-like isoform X2 [Papaver somniferum]